MAESLKDKTAKGLFWGMLNSSTTQILNLAIGILLGRLLSPGEYGILGYIAIFTAIAGNLQSSGFSTYLINMKEPKQEDYNAVFWFNILMSFTLYIILFFCSPLIADFFHQPVLTNVSRFVFLTFVLSSFGITPGAYMAKNLMVKEVTMINSIALITSGITSVVLAFLGFSFWSLAWQQMIYITIFNVGRYSCIPWRPSLHIDLRPIRKMFSFSINILVTMIMNTVNNNIMSLIIGKLFNKEALGNYSQAYKWNNMAYSIVANTTQQVAQPVFASVSDEKEREIRIFHKMIKFTAFLSFPAMFGLALIAHEFILTTIGEKWSDSVPLLQVLCISGAFFPFYTIYQNLIIGKSRSDINMWCNIGQIIIQLGLVLFTYRYGILAMVSAYSAFNILWLLVWHFYANRLIEVKLWDVLKDLLPFISTSLAVMVLTYFMTFSISNTIILLISRVIIASILYLVIMKLSHVVILDECITFFMKKIKK